MRIKIYKVFEVDNPNNFYIGSTKQELKRRMYGHGASSKIKNNKFHTELKNKGIDKFDIGLIRECEVNNKDEQLIEEQKTIDEFKPSLNDVRAKGLDLEREKQRKKIYDKINKPIYYEKNKEHITKYQEQYRTKNKTRINNYHKQNYENKKDAIKLKRKQIRDENIRLEKFKCVQCNKCFSGLSELKRHNGNKH